MWSLIKEKDATEELKLAFIACDKAELAKENILEISKVFKDVDRALNLIVASNILRAYIENFDFSTSRSDAEVVNDMFLSCSRNIALSMELTGDNEWTICIYEAKAEATKKDQLILIASDRAIPCSLNQGRNWEEGVGVAGQCYSKELESIVPYLNSDHNGTAFDIGDRKRPYDDSRYQSIVAVPILVNGFGRPWGVISATSDRAGHFRPNDGGVSLSEGVRVLAGYIALIIAMRQTLANGAPIK